MNMEGCENDQWTIKSTANDETQEEVAIWEWKRNLDFIWNSIGCGFFLKKIYV